MASLQVDERSNAELAALSQYLWRLSTWVAELRLLRMENERRVIERIGHRPALGYYLRLRDQKSPDDDTPCEVVTSHWPQCMTGPADRKRSEKCTDCYGADVRQP